MKKLYVAALALAAFCAQPGYAAEYKIDPAHANILFFIDHMGFSDMVGRFTAVTGSFKFDKETPANSSVTLTLKPESIKTSSLELDKHLQGAKWFDSKQFPDIRFVSNAVVVTGKNTADVKGDLTMRGITKPVTLKATLNKTGINAVTQNPTVGFSVTANITRSEFGIKEYVPMVGDEVSLLAELEGFIEAPKAAR